MIQRGKAIRRLVGLTLLLAVGWAHESAADSNFRQAAGQRLAAALAAHRAIEQSGGWGSVPDGPTLEQGDQGARVAALRRRLAAGGDLGGATDRQDYDADLARAVRRFQARHGLAIDGRVGRQTLVALNLDAAARIGQIEANLARWEALPDLGEVYVLVNIPAMLLDVIERGRMVNRMPIVVGDERHPTPVFSSHFAAVVFNPSWTVPQSIIRKEMLPRLRRDPGYLARNRIRLLDRPEDPFGAAVDWRSASAGQAARHLRQDPGPGNSLGQIKFDIPNPFDVYLHDTPARFLFTHAKRAFSHGCIRVSRPRELAAWALDIDADAVERSIASGETTRVPTPRQIALHVLYLTAFVDPDGTVQFRDDLYGLDAAMIAASAMRRQVPPPAGASPEVGCGEQIN